jgi:hypothetical protein
MGELLFKQLRRRSELGCGGVGKPADRSEGEI